MKILEISDTGIILKDEKEILEQELYSDEEDMIFEVYNILSRQEKIEEIKICVLTEIKDETKISIEEIIKEKNIKIFHEKRSEIKRFYKLLLIVVIFEIVIFLGLFLVNIKRNKEMENLKKERLELKELGEKNQKEIKKLEIKENKLVLIKKNSIYPKVKNILLFFGDGVYIEKLEMKEKSLEITAYSKKLKKIIEVKRALEKVSKNNSIKFDFIKREGEEMRFLIEINLK